MAKSVPSLLCRGRGVLHPPSRRVSYQFQGPSPIRCTELKYDDVVLDIGCGDGRVLVAVAKVFGCRGIGIDVSQACISSAKKMSEAEGVSSLLSLYCADATQSGVLEDFGLAATTVVYLYVYPTLLSQLTDLLRRLKDGGARIVTVQYHMSGSGWEATQCFGGEPSAHLYLAS